MRTKLAALITAILLIVLIPKVQAAPVGVASQPGQPTSGLGSDGPCGSTESSFDNPKWPGNTVYVFQPTGTKTPQTGGSCGASKRPTVAIAHGLNESNPTDYQGLVTNLVSNGNVVIYPTYQDNGSTLQDLVNSYYMVDTGLVAAISRTPRADVSRMGFWGHSLGGGMVPYLVRQSSGRGWGRQALWMTSVTPAYVELVTTPGTRTIHVPAWAREITVSMEDDELADNRIGIDLFESLDLPFPQKTYVRLFSDYHGQPPMVADHTSPAGGNGEGVDLVDYTLWRYADILEGCALFNQGCNSNLSNLGNWSDGTPVVPALVAEHPVDGGPYPAGFAECDTGFGPTLNPDRIAYCGATRISF